jgi:hypothetical protein
MNGGANDCGEKASVVHDTPRRRGVDSPALRPSGVVAQFRLSSPVVRQLLRLIIR